MKAAPWRLVPAPTITAAFAHCSPQGQSSIPGGGRAPPRRAEGSPRVRTIRSLRGYPRRGAQSGDKTFRLLPRAEVPTAWVFVPLLNVEEALDERSWRRGVIVLEDGHHGRRRDLGHHVTVFDIGRKRGSDRARDPVCGDPRQQLVARESGFDVTTAVAPRPQLLHDPGQQSGWGIT
jgi:hypothetical protein